LSTKIPLETTDDFVIVADHIRHPVTGVHARIALFLNEDHLAHSTFNVDRDEERTRLANKAHRMLGPSIQGVYPSNALNHELDMFCWGLWDAYVGGLVAQPSGSDVDDEGCTFALEPYVMDDGGTILFAAPGMGKSYSSLIMAICIDAGLNHLWHTSQRKVLYVNLERSQKSVERRIRQINRCLDIDPARRLLCLHKRGARLADMLPAIQRSIEEHGVQVAVLDSISRAGYGDLTQNEPANAIIDALNSMCPTWLAIGHTPRGDQTHVYGGVHFDAGEDMGVQLITQRGEYDTLGVGFQVVKSNDTGFPPLYVLALEFDRRGLTAVYKARAHQFPEIEAGKKQALGDEIADFLALVGKASATDIAKELARNRSNVATTLATDRRFVCVARQGAKVFYGLLTPDTE
jgi:hypothetical protein